MKKIILLSIAILILGCSKDPKTILKNEIEDIIKEGMNDPSSYEFDSFNCDSITFMSTKELIFNNNNSIKKLNKKNTTDKKDSINSLKLENYRFKKLCPYKLNGSYSFRGKNKFGSNVLAEYKFWADDTYQLMYLIDNTGDTIYKDPEVLIKEVNILIK